MLASKDAMATIPVKDLASAKAFYEGKLRLQKVGADEFGVSTYRSGNSILVVYESKHAGTNQATTATWGLGPDFDAALRALKDAGIEFEHYDFPGVRREGDVHVSGDFKSAWFKDPDGNILNINSG